MAMAGMQRLNACTQIKNTITMASERLIDPAKRKRDTTVERLGGGARIVCTSDAKRWRIGRSIKYAERTVRTVHTTFRRRLRADRSAAAASESAYCGCITVSARRVRFDAAYQHDVKQDASLVTNGPSCVCACVSTSKTPSDQASSGQRIRTAVLVAMSPSPSLYRPTN